MIIAMVASAWAGSSLEIDRVIDPALLVATSAYMMSTQLPSDRPFLVQGAPIPPTFGPDARVVGRTRIEDVGADALSDWLGSVPGVVIWPSLAAVGYGYTQGRLSHDGAFGRRQGARFLMLYTEALAINTMITDVFKTANRRPRPYTYSPAYLAELSAYEADPTGPDPRVAYDQRSFWSGHTASAGTWSFFTAHSFAKALDPGPGSGAWQRARVYVVSYSAASLVTGFTGALRVKAGHHYPSDVFVGGLMGAATGLIVSELHMSDRLRLGVRRTSHGTQTIALNWLR